MTRTDLDGAVREGIVSADQAQRLLEYRGGWGGCVTAILYGLLALLLSHWFLERRHL